MSSIQRLLNDEPLLSDERLLQNKRPLNIEIDAAFEQNSYTERLGRQDLLHNSSGSSEIPLFVDKSWDELWGGILSVDFTNEDDCYREHSNGAGVNPFYNVEEGIESWALQDLAPSHDLSQLSQPYSVEPPPVTRDSLDSSALICYGMISRAAVKIGGNMLDVDKRLSSRQYSNNDHCYFTVGRPSTQLALRFLDGTDFGVLNTHTSGALEKLIDQPSIQFDVLGHACTIRETVGRATKSSDAVVRVNINVYGPTAKAKDVGRHLTAHKVYLQRPDSQRPGSVYDNPHSLKFPDLQISNLELKPEVGINHVATSHGTEDFRKEISDVYASLTRGTNLNRVEGDRRLKTELLPHQKQALDFMVQRETGPIPPEFCLWKPMEGANEGWYLHAVTKAKTRIQNSETGGGILADEMGMGKSLSTLALITKTLNSAFDWIGPGISDDLDSNHKKRERSRATLVIVPSAILINEWLNEIKVHLDGTLSTINYHGQKRKALVPMLQDADIVLTTYHTLVADFGEIKGKTSPLHEIEWFRVVLDEAHIIRRQKTKFYRAVSELKAQFRWCLTGTPIQNRLEDIGALFAFIRAAPFHSIAMFRRFVAIPYDESEERRAVAIRNLTLLLDAFCLRRSKDLLHLPEPQQRVRFLEFSDEERDQYEQTKRIMNRALRQRAGESYCKSTFGMFQIQLQLRILCNHGTYQHAFTWAKRSLLDEREDALCSTGGTGDVHCSACRQSMPILGSNNVNRKYAENCAHVLCSECLEENEQIRGDKGVEVMTCPLCAISGVSVPRSGIMQTEHNDSYLRPEGQSSKMDALIADVKEDLWKTKSIIFSCWTNTLNLIERYLRTESIPFQRIDGECPLSRRQKILDDFSKTSSIPVLIMTTGTGAFGLNLTSANRVFIVEPQWNPSVENQAIARAIRIKQTSSVLVTRYMVRGTVEQEMRSQQERKLRIAEVGSGGVEG